jgi:hypothetical protein
MQDSAPEPGSSSAPDSPGLTRFLVENPSSVGVSREALSEAVHALLRERDYLRQVRDLQLAEHESALAGHRRHAEEIERLRQEERRAYQEQADALRRELIALTEDRDAWRARATRSLWSRVRLTLSSLWHKAAPGRRNRRSEEDPLAAGDEMQEA